jgi:hypothetical protein
LTDTRVSPGASGVAVAAGLNVSRTTADALSEQLDRRAKIAELDRYLAELESELGPLSDAERETARTWADRVVTSTPTAC